MSDIEHPDARRARRLAEARALRDTPERAAQIAELQARKAAEAAANPKPAARSTSTTPRTRSSSGTGSTRAPKAAPVVKAPNMFGHPMPEWFAMRDAARARLEAGAAEGRLITPDELWTGLAQDLGKELGEQRFQLPGLLRHVADQGFEDLGLLPTALVVESERKGPGRAFFTTALEHGMLAGLFVPLGDEGWAMPPDLRRFWRDQVDALFERFATEDEVEVEVGVEVDDETDDEATAPAEGPDEG